MYANDWVQSFRGPYTLAMSCSGLLCILLAFINVLHNFLFWKKKELKKKRSFVRVSKDTNDCFSLKARRSAENNTTWFTELIRVVLKCSEIDIKLYSKKFLFFYTSSILWAWVWQMFSLICWVKLKFCPVTCGFFPGRGLNPCTLHWQADS